MVRYKARYLLFNILYPPTGAAPAQGTAPATHIDHLLPSDPAITPGELAALFRDSLLELHGDWGAGVAGNLSGTTLCAYQRRKTRADGDGG